MELFTYRDNDEGLPKKPRIKAMIAVMTLTTMVVFDGTVAAIMISKIAEDLQVPTSAAIWVVNSYLLSVSMTLAIFAALSKHLGFRRVFLFGVSLFSLASLGCALTHSLPALIALRFLQGIGGAATVSIGPAILRTIFPNRLLGNILGINALLVAVCLTVSPVIGGFVLTYIDWHWIFAINVPLGLVSIALTWHNVPHNPTLQKGRFDYFGALLSALFLSGLLMMTQAIAEDKNLPLSLLYALISAVSLVGFIFLEKRSTQPLLPLAIFHIQRFRGALLTSFISFISQNIMLIVLPLLYIHIYHFSVLDTGLLFMAWPIGIVLAAPRAGKLIARTPAPIIASIGLGIYILGLIATLCLPSQPMIWGILLANFICGLGFGSYQPCNNHEILANVPRANSGYASGMLAIARTFGQCIGGGIIGMIIALFNDQTSYHEIRLIIALCIFIAILALISSLWRIKYAHAAQ